MKCPYCGFVEDKVIDSRPTEENAAKAAAQKGEAVPTESANDGEGDEQFEINDSRSFGTMYKDISNEGLQPVLNDYLYV